MTKNRGAVLITLLMVSMIVVMFIGALLMRSRMNLFDSSQYRDSLKAEQAARAGVNHILSLLEEDPDFSDDLQVTISGATYTITFDSSNPAFSVNNLSSDAPATQLSLQGHTVAARSADVVVLGTCGRSRRTLRVVAQRGFSSIRSISAVGRVELSGDITVDGIKSLLPPPGETEPEPAPGGILSKYRSTDPSEPSIEWAGGSSFNLGELSLLESAAPDGGAAFSANLTSNFPEQTVDNSAADTIPVIDVATKVADGMSQPAVAAGGSTLTGNLYLKNPGSVNGDLTMTGDIILSEGTLFIDGDLTLNGGIKGRGAIYVSGDVTMVGGNTVVQTGEPNGVALLAGGNATFQGIDAAGYLAFLAGTDPAVNTALSNVNGLLNHYAATPGHHWSTGVQLSKHPLPFPAATDNVWVNPIPGPDGRHNMGFSSGALPSLILAIKSTGLHLTDPRAEKVVKALEEMDYHFRDNDGSVDMTGLELTDDYQVLQSGVLLNRSVVEAMRVGPWDDLTVPDQFKTHSHLQYGSIANGLEFSESRRQSYLANNPIDFSFLGNSVYQGMVYVNGNVEASQNFSLIGALITQGDVTLTNGSKLIFNEEYRNLLGSAVPIGIIHYEEI